MRSMTGSLIAPTTRKLLIRIPIGIAIAAAIPKAIATRCTLM